MYQKVVIVGHLGRDPEMRYTAEGVPVTRFSVATNHRWTGADGEPKESTTWFRVSAWRRLAETCNQYLSKGRAVLVEGRMNPEPNAWIDKESGEPRASYELNALTVKFLGKGNGSSTEELPDKDEEDEIPF